MNPSGGFFCLPEFLNDGAVRYRRHHIFCALSRLFYNGRIPKCVDAFCPYRFNALRRFGQHISRAVACSTDGLPLGSSHLLTDNSVRRPDPVRENPGLNAESHGRIYSLRYDRSSLYPTKPGDHVVIRFRHFPCCHAGMHPNMREDAYLLPGFPHLFLRQQQSQCAFIHGG